MKLRYKLITTIASLCIMVTMLLFGVFAAVMPTLSVSGRVNFVSNSVFADIDIQNANSSAPTRAQLAFTSLYTTTFDQDDPEDTEYSQTIEMPKMDSTNVFSGYRIIITDKTLTNALSGVGIESITMPKLNTSYTNFATLTVYVNDVALTEENVTQTLESAVANDAVKITIDVVLEISNLSNAPKKVYNLFDTSNADLTVTLKRVNL